MKILLHRNKWIISFDILNFLIIFEFSDSKITKQPYAHLILPVYYSVNIEERQREMASSVVKNALKTIREKGLGNFFRELKEEGYTYIRHLFPNLFFSSICERSQSCSALSFFIYLFILFIFLFGVNDFCFCFRNGLKIRIVLFFLLCFKF